MKGVLLSIPSPSINGFSLGPLTIRFYALCLIAGIIAGWIIGLRRWRARGGSQETFESVLLWAIPMGIVGARVYHVLTHLSDYVGDGRNPWSVFFIWEGGIAIYGAIGGGALAAWIACRVKGAKFAALADSLAPGLAVGQALGRLGNWFNSELYGWPTDLPWGLEIAPEHRLPGFEQYETFHPTFLYELLWNLLVAGLLIWADRRFRLGRGKVFALYLALYGFGRFFTEGMRTDPSETMFGPLRQNQFAAILICLAGILLLALLARFRPGREVEVERPSSVVPEPSEEASEEAIPEPAEESSDAADSGTEGSLEGDQPSR
ncbi:MAG: prolipoprotein diacylglyceryl transferase [Propionicimonas sp.]|jgi:prolipoprotein diacylglyceryl transferase